MQLDVLIFWELFYVQRDNSWVLSITLNLQCITVTDNHWWWYVHLSPVIQVQNTRSHANRYLVRVFIICSLQPLIVIVLFILIDVNLILLIGRSLARSREWDEWLSLVEVVTRCGGHLCPRPRDPPLEPVLASIHGPQYPSGEVPARRPCDPPLEGITHSGPDQAPTEGRTSCLHLGNVTY